MSITDRLHALIDERAHIGTERYGVPLTPECPKDMLIEARDEAADALFYLECAIAQRETSPVSLLAKHTAELRRLTSLHESFGKELRRNWVSFFADVGMGFVLGVGVAVLAGWGWG